jgi:hypothetical protein
MKLDIKNPPRIFKVGVDQDIEIKDCGDILLEPNEQISFVNEGAARYDFACKEWGYYATPSINHRLRLEGYKTALVRNEQKRLYLMVVYTEKMHLFEEYCSLEKQEILQWLDEK